MMNDELITRTAVMESLTAEYNRRGTGDGLKLAWIEKAVSDTPSAQPEPCGDVVSRNDIIQKLNTMDRYVSEELRLCDTDKKFPKNEVFIVDDVYEEIVENLPSAQSETHDKRMETYACDCISRQAAIDAADRADYTGLAVEDVKKVTDEVVKELKRLPSAQPERTDCTDCPEYDTERHSCPRYCDVIRKTLEEAKQERTGRWMATEADEPCFYRCSECGRLIDEMENFCPNCGAKMEDETNG